MLIQFGQAFHNYMYDVFVAKFDFWLAFGLIAQLLSLQHVSWPAANRTLTDPVARHVLEAHRQIADVIESRDAAAARRLMDDHVKMIRARRVSEADAATPDCC